MNHEGRARRANRSSLLLVVATLTPLFFALAFVAPRADGPPGVVVAFAVLLGLAAVLAAAAAVTRPRWLRASMLLISGLLQVLLGLWLVVAGWGLLLLASGGLAFVSALRGTRPPRGPQEAI